MGFLYSYFAIIFFNMFLNYLCHIFWSEVNEAAFSEDVLGQIDLYLKVYGKYKIDLRFNKIKNYPNSVYPTKN